MEDASRKALVSLFLPSLFFVISSPPPHTHTHTPPSSSSLPPPFSTTSALVQCKTFTNVRLYLRNTHLSLSHTHTLTHTHTHTHTHTQFEYQQAQLEHEIENLSWKVERLETTSIAVREGEEDMKGEGRRICKVGGGGYVRGGEEDM